MKWTLRVLLLDDSEILLNVTREFLVRQGFDVRAVASIPEFERLLQGWHPHVVLTDVSMPDASGPELCRALKSRLDRLVPVLLFSSLPDPELGELADQCGADGFVSKHNGLGALRRQLEEVCEAILW